MHIRARRVFEPPDSHDGFRVLVDRTWPDGLEKDGGKIDLWIRDVAPSVELDAWFDHDRRRWPEFQFRYRHELAGRSADLDALLLAAGDGDLTLVYAARDDWHNHAVVLKALLEARLRARG
ncbi:MAG: DUF488 family protein [Thermomicrobiales bacterium]